MRIQLTMAAALLPLSAGICAQEAAGTSGEYFDELPVVLSASRLVQRVDQAPASVTVIDRATIRASGVRDVVDLFRLVPGMVVGMYKGHRPILGFNGLADPYFRQLQILIDGVSVYSPFWGGGEWNDLPISLDDVERIEVVRGPNAATFGANSFLGVVNIITRDPATERGPQASASFGENGIRDVLLRQAGASGNFRYRITAGQRGDHGLDAYPDTRRTNFANLRGHYRLSDIDELRLQLGYSGGGQQEGIYAVRNHTDGPRTSHHDAGSLQVRWSRTRGADDESWLQFSHAQRSHRETLPYVLDAFLPFFIGNYPLDFGYRQRRTEIELQQTRRVDDSLRAAWAAQARLDGAQSRTYFATDAWQESRLYRVFGNLEWRPSQAWVVSGGAMVEWNSLTGTSLSPSIAVIRQVVPDHGIRVRFASANRTPTLFEQNVDWRYEAPAGLQALLAGPPINRPDVAARPLDQSRLTRQDLNDERIHSQELSYLGQFPSLRLSVDLSVFEHHLKGLISWERYPFLTIRSFFDVDRNYTFGNANSDSARVRGQAAALRWRPSTGLDIQMAGSRTIIHADGPNAGSLSASAPVHTVSLLAAQDLAADWQASLGYYRVGAMRALGGTSEVLPATDKVDLRLAKRFRIGGSRAEVALVVRNATDDIPMFYRKDVDRRTSWLNVRYEH